MGYHHPVADTSEHSPPLADHSQGYVRGDLTPDLHSYRQSGRPAHLDVKSNSCQWARQTTEARPDPSWADFTSIFKVFRILRPPTILAEPSIRESTALDS